MTFTHPEYVIIDQPQQTPPFTGNLLDVKLGGASKAFVDQDGNVFINGNVGIGTTNPGEILAAQNPTRPTISVSDGPTKGRLALYTPGTIYLIGNASYNGSSWNLDDTSKSGWIIEAGQYADLWGVSRLSPGANPRTFTNLMELNSLGRLGINTRGVLGVGGETGMLHIITGDAATPGAIIRGVANQIADLQQWQNPSGAVLVEISAAGNVGIGTVNPSEKLEVVGNIKASGNMNVSGLTESGQLKVGGGFQQTPPSPLDLGLTIDGDGTINTNGNLLVLRNDETTPGSPTKWHLGRQGFLGGVPEHSNYFFWESRLNRNGWWWSGWNTFRHPTGLTGDPNTPVARGYGYYPFRNMAKNYLLEANGWIVTDLAFYGPVLYFQSPVHIDLVGPYGPTIPEPPTKPPDGYDSDRHPYHYLGLQTTLSNPVSPGSTQITVGNPSGFAAGDEIFIDEQVPPPGDARSEINQIDNVVGNTFNLKRDTKQYSAGKPVKKVRELGAVQPDRSAAGLGVYIKRNGDDLVLKDNRGAEITLQQIRAALGLP